MKESIAKTFFTDREVNPLTEERVTKYMDLLEQKINEQTEYSGSYAVIVTKLFDLCINRQEEYGWSFDTSEMIVIGADDCPGTLVFVIPKTNFWARRLSDYIITHTTYGTCSGCDTLKRITDDGHELGLPSDEQVKDYMTLALHLVQKTKWLGHDE